jgi:hypothetical protein
MEQLPKIVRERLKRPTGGDHPHPDLLTAFAEQALPDHERSRILLHLSRCEDCRDVLALAVPAFAAADSLDTVRSALWFQWPALRWGAAVACVVIVGSAVLLRYDTLHLQSAKPAAVREEPQAELYAYERSDRDTGASRQFHEQHALSSATESTKEKDMARAGDQVLKRPVSPKLRAPVAAPVMALSPGFVEKKQVVVGSMHGGATSGGAVGAMMSAPAPTRVVVADQTAVDESNKSELEARNVTGLATLGKSSETIEVQAAANTVETETPADKREAPGKAKPASSAMMDNMAAPPAMAQNQVVRSEETVSQKMDRAKLRRSPLSRWTISSDGRLQHSIDAGQTWQPVAVVEKASFRALSANGPDVWVGGAAGLLYHSADSGASWTQMKPAFTNATLTADIAAIEFTDRQHGKITTSTGEVWTTEDAGQTWRKQ